MHLVQSCNIYSPSHFINCAKFNFRFKDIVQPYLEKLYPSSGMNMIASLAKADSKSAIKYWESMKDLRGQGIRKLNTKAAITKAGKSQSQMLNH